MKEIFDFAELEQLITEKKKSFKILIDSMHGGIF